MHNVIFTILIFCKCSLVALRTFTLLYTHLNHPSLELLHLHKLKLHAH